MKKKINNLLLFPFILLSLVLLAACCLFFYPPVASGPAVIFRIKSGTPLKTIANDLQLAGVIESAGRFEFTAKFFKRQNKIRAGQFTLRKKSSPYRLLNALTNGPQTLIKVTIPEGVTMQAIAAILAKKLELDSATLTALAGDSGFCASFGIMHRSLEGYLYPETYLFNYGMNEKQVLSELVRQFKKQVPDSVDRAAQQLGFTFYQMLTLASILEGEAMLDAELPLISSVYHNRLRRGMLLQADPTIQYIIPDGPRRLLKRDLRIDSPYNTYRYRGLPPGPISNPGIKAIQAALHPAGTDYVYFVANGDGSHTFSTTLSEHLRAKSRFDKIRRAVAAGKRKS